MNRNRSASNAICVLNDNFRTTFLGGQVVVTDGVAALPIDVKARVILATQSFKDFGEGADPYREHDFGSFDVDGEHYFFKIDYYAADLQHGAENPDDPEKTTRVLTIMRADEY